MVAAEEEETPVDDVDRTDFTDPALQEDKVFAATGPHSEIESAFIMPENPEASTPPPRLRARAARAAALAAHPRHIARWLTGDLLSLSLSLSPLSRSLALPPSLPLTGNPPLPLPLPQSCPSARRRTC